MDSKLTTQKFNQRILQSEDYKLNNKIAKISSKKSFIEIYKKYQKKQIMKLFEFM